MSFTAEELVARFAWEASLVQAVARPELASPAGEVATPEHPTRAWVPVLATLASSVDAVLVRGDGFHFEVVLVVDRTREPSRRFPLERAALQEACGPCVAFTGRLHGHALPVSVLVLEVRDGGDDDGARLAGLKGSAGVHKVAVQAVAADLRTGRLTVASRRPFGSELVRHLRRSFRDLQEGRPALLPEAPPAPSRRRPLATFIVLGVLVGMFGAEVIVDGSSAWWSPRTSTLYGLGGLAWSALVQDRAYYRILSCGFLHAGLLHLGLNGLALLMAGSFAERLAGPAFLLVTFVASLAGGSAASMALSGGHAFTVGASGAIMGLIASALVLTGRMGYGPQRTMARSRLWQWLVPALIPLAFRTGFGTIDVGAHLGGAVTGAGLGFWLLRRWDRRRPWPHPPPAPARRILQGAAALACTLTVVALGWAIAQSPDKLADARLDERLAPDQETGKVAEQLNQALRAGASLAPAQQAALESSFTDLQERYPDDPRGYYLGALWAFSRDQDAKGEELLRHGLANPRVFERAFGKSDLETDMRRYLARAALKRQDEAGARRDLAPACARLAPDDPLRELCPPGASSPSDPKHLEQGKRPDPSTP